MLALDFLEFCSMYEFQFRVTKFFFLVFILLCDLPNIERLHRTSFDTDRCFFSFIFKTQYSLIIAIY